MQPLDAHPFERIVEVATPTPVAQLYWSIPINAELANAKRSTFFLHWSMPIYSELAYIYNYIPNIYRVSPKNVCTF